MSKRSEEEGRPAGIPVKPKATPEGKDGGRTNEKIGSVADRPHVGIPLTPSRERRTIDLAIEYWDHDMRGSPCLDATATYFGIRHLLHFMHSMKDFIRAMRKGGHTIRQRTSLIRKKPYTVQEFCNRLDSILNRAQAHHEGRVPDAWVFTTRYIYEGDKTHTAHIHATDTHGRVVVDTAPMGSDDDREVTGVWGVWS